MGKIDLLASLIADLDKFGFLLDEDNKTNDLGFGIAIGIIICQKTIYKFMTSWPEKVNFDPEELEKRLS